jgi:hypothetical protein
MDESFRPWRTTRHVDINRHNLIDPLHKSIIVEHAAA